MDTPLGHIEARDADMALALLEVIQLHPPRVSDEDDAVTWVRAS